MTKLLKTVFTLGVGLVTLAATVDSSFAAKAAKASKSVKTTPAVQATSDSAVQGNHIVATYVGQDNISHVVLLSDIKPYLAKTANPSQEQIEKATQAYVTAQVKKLWEQRTKASVKVTTQEVEAVLYDEAAKNGLSYQDFLRALAYHGINVNQIRKNIHDQIFQAKQHAFLSQNVEAQLDRERLEKTGYDNYMADKDAGKLEMVNTKDLAYILIQENPVFDSKQALTIIKDVQQKINSGSLTFAQAARQYSDDIVSAAQNGKYSKLAELPEAENRAIGSAIAKLKVGQVSQPIHIPNKGWELVKYLGDAKVEADVNYYINKEYQKEIQNKSNAVNSLESFLLNSVVIKYLNVDGSPRD